MPVAGTSSAASGSTSGRRRGLGHTAAGFTVGVLAVAVGVFFARPADNVPLSAAAQHAEQAAAIRIALDRDARPSAQPVPSSEAVPIAFVGDGDDTLFSHRHATRVAIPSIDLDASVSPVGMVFRGGELRYDVPQREAGQYVGSAAPGTAGNTVIGGHVARGGGSGVFARLPQVRAGDVVEVYRGDEVFRYFITEVRVVAADATYVMRPTQEATLTLITCFPDDNYAERLVVVGRLL
jgi:LPXTG-site transpeptidase (sortase) family protein